MTQETGRGVEAPPPRQAPEPDEFQPPPPAPSVEEVVPPPVGAPPPAPAKVSLLTRVGSDAWLARVAIALGTLAVVGASLVLTYHQLLLPEAVFHRYLGENQLSRDARSLILKTMVAGGALPLIVALLHIVRRRADGARAVVRVADLLAPLVLLWTLPSLFAFRVWYDAPAAYLVYFSAVMLAMERLLRRSFAMFPETDANLALSDRTAGRLGLGIVTLAAIGYAYYTGYFSILEHKRLATSAYDLGIYDNLISNNLAGRFFRCPVLGPNVNSLSNHAEFATVLIAPIYALRPDSTTLLAMQSIFLGAAAIPLYLFASTQLPRVASVIIAVGYLLYAPLHGPNFYDFHWVPMALPLWFTLFFALMRRKKVLITVSIILLLTIREEMGVMLAVLGVFLAASGYWFRLGITLAITGTLSFSIIKFVIMPLAGTWWFSGMYQSLIAPGEEGYGSVIKTLLVNPNYVWKTLATEQKLTYFLHLMAPLAFLPFRRPLLVFLAVPGFFFTLLTTSYEPTLSIRFQYTCHWIPWVFGASVFALKVLTATHGHAYRKAAVATLGLGILAHSYVYGAVLQRNTFVGGFHRVAFGMTPEESARYDMLRRMIAQIPRSASVAATETECPHIANRVDAYTLRIAHGDADFLLVRRGMIGGEERNQLVRAMKAHEYGVLESGNDLFLFKKGLHAPKDTKYALRKLGISLPHDAKTQQGLRDEP